MLGRVHGFTLLWRFSIEAPKRKWEADFEVIQEAIERLLNDSSDVLSPFLLLVKPRVAWPKLKPFNEDAFICFVWLDAFVAANPPM